MPLLSIDIYTVTVFMNTLQVKFYWLILESTASMIECATPCIHLSIRRRNFFKSLANRFFSVRAKYTTTVNSSLKILYSLTELMLFSYIEGSCTSDTSCNTQIYFVFGPSSKGLQVELHQPVRHVSNILKKNTVHVEP